MFHRRDQDLLSTVDGAGLRASDAAAGRVDVQQSSHDEVF
jgi:hypothetical protein